MLPDDVLLAIFDFCGDKYELEAWQALTQVCRRWRWVVFGSPRRLGLQLVCTSRTPARDTLNVWPALPLFIRCYHNPIEIVDNVVAVLERSNCVREIDISHVSSSELEKISEVMQEPFPELTHLGLWSDDQTVPVLPDSFLGGSAPRLRSLEFRGVPFPGLPKLLLSATHLLDLCLWDIPHSGYFSPEAMISALSTLTGLQELRLEFQSPRSHPDLVNRRPPPPTRIVLPVLQNLKFKGVIEYLEDLVACIDSLRLDKLYITFFNQIVFDTPQLMQFVSRTPNLKALEKVHVNFDISAAKVNLSSETSGYGELEVKILCKELDWQVSSLEQVCAWCLFPVSASEDLYVYGHPFWRPGEQDNIDNALWLELFHPFAAVKNLYLSEEFARRIVPALQELVERLMVVLPTLENMFLEELQTSGPVQEGIQLFVSARQASHPIAVSRWDRDEVGYS
jgi:hypothetical protein